MSFWKWFSIPNCGRRRALTCGPQCDTLPSVIEEPPGYAVLIADPGHFKPAEIARALAALRKVPVHDVANAARKCWGIVEDAVGERAARELAAALSREGLSALAVPSTLLEDLPPPQPVARLDLSPEGFFPELGSRSRKVGWESLALAAAAGFRVTLTRKIKTEEGPGLGRKALKIGLTLAGIPVGLGGAKKEVEKTLESSDLVFYLDLILKDSGGRFRIDAQSFDYSCLKARMGYNALGNFKQLLTEFVVRAKEAACNRGAKMLLDGKPVREMGYESLADLERESRWLLTLQSLRR